MRVLVTRPEVDAAPLVAALEARGHDAIVQPLLTIEPVAPDPPLETADVQALLFTSANGVRAFAAASSERGLSAFAVGDATAEAAEAAGFAEVESAGGDVQDLAQLVTRRLDPAAGPVLHVAGTALAGDLQGDLEGAGFTVRRSVLYAAEPVRQLADPVRAALAEEQLDAVLFFSPRTAKSFVRLVAGHGLAAACERCRAVCLSDAVADALGALTWAGIHVAERPNQQALLDCLDALEGDMGAPGPEPGREEEIMAEEVEAQGSNGAEGGASGVIAAFGGIRPMAHKLGLAVSTVQGWKERDAIPANRHAQVLAAADSLGIVLDEADLAALAGAGEQAEAVQPVEVEILPPLEAEPEPEPADSAPQAPAPEAAAPPPEVSRRWLMGLGLVAGILVVLAIAVVVIRGLWTPEPEDQVATSTATDAEAPASDAEVPEAEVPEAQVPEAQAPEARADVAAAAGTEVQDADAPETMPAEAETQEAEPVVESTPAAVEPQVDQPPEEAPAPRADEPRETIVVPEPQPALDAAPETALEEDRTPESLAAILDDLAARLDRLEDVAAAPAVSADQLAQSAQAQEALASRVEALDARLAGLEAQTGPAGPRPAGGDVALMIALAQLADVLGRGGPYSAELDLLRDAVAQDPVLTGLLAPLEAHAAAGAPTRAALERDFPEVARAVIVGGVGGGDPGLFAGVLRRLSDVVTVRPVGEVEGEHAGALVARAEHRLQAGDLAGALAELDGLGGAAAEAAADWRGGAEARLAVEAALSALRAQAVAGLLAAGG